MCGGRVFCGAAMGGAAMARGLPRGAMRSCGWFPIDQVRLFGGFQVSQLFFN